MGRHSCAVLEAEMRGLADEITAFDDEVCVVRDALWYCDMVTGPTGERCRFPARVSEIQRRYGEDTLVSRFIRRAAAGELGAAVERTLARMSRADIDQPRLD